MFAYYKQASETIDGVGIDFSNELATGETIQSYTVTDSNAGVAIDAATTNNEVVATLTGGTAGEIYNVVYSIVGSLGTTASNTIILHVTANPMTCTVYADLRNADFSPAVGIKLKGKIKYPTAIEGAVINSDNIEAITDQTGHVEMEVVRGAVVTLFFPPIRSNLTIDTTGKTTVNIADVVNGTY